MKTYYNPDDLERFGTVGDEASELWKGFLGWYGPATEGGSLSKREKSLIALAVAGAVQCPYCIDSYTRTCLEQGITEEEMTEAFHVAAAIRGGATLAHALQMKNVVNDLAM